MVTLLLLQVVAYLVLAAAETVDVVSWRQSLDMGGGDSLWASRRAAGDLEAGEESDDLGDPGDLVPLRSREVTSADSNSVPWAHVERTRPVDVTEK